MMDDMQMAERIVCNTQAQPNREMINSWLYWNTDTEKEIQTAERILKIEIKRWLSGKKDTRQTPIEVQIATLREYLLDLYAIAGRSLIVYN